MEPGARLWLLGSLVLGLAAGAARGEDRFVRLDHSTGPSHNSIFAITQDRLGFLWIGTQDGLNRFDGYDFEVHRHDDRDPGSLSANRVNTVLEDEAGRLWVGTSVGLDRFDRVEGRFRPYDLPGTDGDTAVLDLFTGPTGTLWAGTGVGLLRYDGEVDLWRSVLEERPPGLVRRVRESPDGVLWLLVDRPEPGANELWRLASVDDQPERFRVGEELGLDLDAAGRPHLGAGGPARLDREGGRAEGPAAASRGVKEVLVIPDGTVWAGTGSGVEVSRPPTVGGEPLLERPFSDRGDILSGHVTTLFRDRWEILWLGTENGLFLADPHRKPFRHLGSQDGVGSRREVAEPGVPVSSLVEAGDGTIWAGAFEPGGLYRLDPDPSGTGGLRRFAGGLPPESVWALLVEGDRLLIGMTGAFCSLELASERLECGAIDSPAQSLVLDRHGRLWRAGQGAIHVRQTDGSWVTHRYPARPSLPGQDEVTYLLADGDGIWVARWGGPLLRFDLDSERFEEIPRVDERGWSQVSPIFDLQRDPDGVLWLGTGDGLSRWEPGAETMEHLGHRDGLPGTNVYALSRDRQGRLWLGTNRGLTRFDPHATGRSRFRTYGTRDDVVNVEFNRNARWVTADGRFLFGGLAGVTSFRPEAIVDDPVLPVPVVTGLEILGEEGIRQVRPWGRGELKLRVSDAAVTIDYVGIAFTNPEGHRYSYRLVGEDDRWVDAGGDRRARFSSLEPGRYRFEVRVANHDGHWSERPAALELIVPPPFWRTWWFRLLVVAAIVALLVAAHRLRVQRLIEIERMRLRIAGDLHDELGSDLSGIALTAARLRRRGELGDADRRRLGEVEETSHRVMEGLRDIVWTIDPEQDSVESLEHRLRSIAGTLLAGVNTVFEPRLSTGRGDASSRARALDMATRRAVLLIFKELLHNVVRHAGASEVRIGLHFDGEALRLEVVDDGRGFDPTESTSGTGLSSLRRRAQRLGGEVLVDTEPGAGTRVRVTIPTAGRAG